MNGLLEVGREPGDTPGMPAQLIRHLRARLEDRGNFFILLHEIVENGDLLR